METKQKPRFRFWTSRRFWATLLVVIGLAITIIYGIRSVRSFRQLQYIREQGLDRGVASVEAIQPWMPIRYVSVAYGVPEEYIFAQLDIPFDRRSSNDTLGGLNRRYQLGWSEESNRPAIIDQVAEAIEAYQENPVATGLRDIRPWMTIRYIANSTGVPEAYLLEQLGIESDDNNVFRPLDDLAHHTRYEGGPRGLGDAIKAVLAKYEAEEQ
jgi:hypothetical protein